MGRFDEWLDDTRPVTVAPVTGIGDTIGMLMSHGNISPYIMAWLITGHCCKVSDEAAFCLIQRPYISKTLLTRRISPRGSP